jgi:hypothetical protein
MTLHPSFAGVLAGAYLRGHIAAGRGTLVHAVLRDDEGVVVKVLCGRVAVESMSDDMMAPEVVGPATCARCVRALKGGAREEYMERKGWK